MGLSCYVMSVINFALRVHSWIRVSMTFPPRSLHITPSGTTMKVRQLGGNFLVSTSLIPPGLLTYK